MLKFELVKFEAQDVITASGVAADPCANGHNVNVTVEGGKLYAVCSVCGKKAEGTEINGGDLK